MGNQKEAVVQLVIQGWARKDHPAQAANGEEDEKPAQVDHRCCEADPPAPESRQPIVDFHPRRDRNQKRRHSKGGVHRRGLPHGEEVMQPDHEGENGDAHRGGNNPGVAVKTLPGIGGSDFRHHPESRKDEDVNFRVAEHPE
jgi:hypothetical protein